MGALAQTNRRGSALIADQADKRNCAKWRRTAEQVERLVKLGSFEVNFGNGELTWSEGTYAIFGVPPGRPISVEEALSFYDKPVRDSISRQLESSEQTGESFDLTVPFRTRTGEERWARMIAQVEIIAGSKRLFGVIRDITVEQDAEEQLRRLANQDVVTGLANRRAFLEHLQEAVSRSANFGLCIVDVDRFKAVNDAHGHEVGDFLLQAIAKRLSEGVCTTDFVARLGGDEFALVLHELRN